MRVNDAYDPFPEGCPDCGKDAVTEDPDSGEHCTNCGWRN